MKKSVYQMGISPALVKEIVDSFGGRGGIIVATSTTPYWAVDAVFPAFMSYFRSQSKQVFEFDERGKFDPKTFAEDCAKLCQAPPAAVKFPMARDAEIAQHAMEFAAKGIALLGFHARNAAAVDERVAAMGIAADQWKAVPRVTIEDVGSV